MTTGVGDGDRRRGHALRRSPVNVAAEGAGDRRRARRRRRTGPRRRPPTTPTAEGQSTDERDAAAAADRACGRDRRPGAGARGRTLTGAGRPLDGGVAGRGLGAMPRRVAIGADCRTPPPSGSPERVGARPDACRSVAVRCTLARSRVPAWSRARSRRDASAGPRSTDRTRRDSAGPGPPGSTGPVRRRPAAAQVARRAAPGRPAFGVGPDRARHAVAAGRTRGPAPPTHADGPARRASACRTCAATSARTST